MQQANSLPTEQQGYTW